jgi:hypothetical protein
MATRASCSPCTGLVATLEVADDDNHDTLIRTEGRDASLHRLRPK